MFALRCSMVWPPALKSTGVKGLGQWSQWRLQPPACVVLDVQSPRLTVGLACTQNEASEIGDSSTQCDGPYIFGIRSKTGVGTHWHLFELGVFNGLATCTQEHRCQIWDSGLSRDCSLQCVWSAWQSTISHLFELACLMSGHLD